MGTLIQRPAALTIGEALSLAMMVVAQRCIQANGVARGIDVDNGAALVLVDVETGGRHKNLITYLPAAHALGQHDGVGAGSRVAVQARTLRPAVGLRVQVHRGTVHGHDAALVVLAIAGGAGQGNVQLTTIGAGAGAAAELGATAGDQNAPAGNIQVCRGILRTLEHAINGDIAAVEVAVDGDAGTRRHRHIASAIAGQLTQYGGVRECRQRVGARVTDGSIGYTGGGDAIHMDALAGKALQLGFGKLDIEPVRDTAGAA